MTITGNFWRLIDTGSCPGRDNMAIDEALFRCFDPAESTPVLRLYGWQPPALSLGRFQKAFDDLDLTRCDKDNLAVVRRITGGGAIYHADELTYSLVCSTSHIPPASTVKDSFRILTSFLLGFYRSLGLNPSYAVDLATPGSRLGERTPLCFAGKESYDIVVNGRKIGGNAQRRSRHLIFQHGSVPLNDRLTDGLVYLKNSPELAGQAATSLSSQGVTFVENDLKQILKQQFEQNLGVTLRTDVLTVEEERISKRLAEGKYLSRRWNLEGEENEDTT